MINRDPTPIQDLIAQTEAFLARARLEDWHLDGCEAFHEHWLDEARTVLQKHPNLCPACFGEGAERWTENGAPHGCGYWPMEMADVCGHCEGQGRCAVCGAEWSDEECEEAWDCSHEWSRPCGCPQEGALLGYPPLCYCWIYRDARDLWEL